MKKTEEAVLEVKNLWLEIQLPHLGPRPVLRNISLRIHPREVLALVGESGCGKSLLAQSIIGLLPERSSFRASSQIIFQGKNLCALSSPHLHRLRGKKIGFIFQDPLSALNPVLTIDYQMREMFLTHQKELSYGETSERINQLLMEVGISDPDRIRRSYPHQLSGGMRQRVLIAQAISQNPQLLIADEPTTALDMTLRTQILELLVNVTRTRNMGLLLITHDLLAVKHFSDRVGVMYFGALVEIGRNDIIEEPRHPYTRALREARPSPALRGKDLFAISGQVPALSELPPSGALGACSFAPRCPGVQKSCLSREPEEISHSSHMYRCLYPLTPVRKRDIVHG